MTFALTKKLQTRRQALCLAIGLAAVPLVLAAQPVLADDDDRKRREEEDRKRKEEEDRKREEEDRKRKEDEDHNRHDDDKKDRE